MCDNNSPERQTDISNCGTCFHSCLVPNSDPVVPGRRVQVHLLRRLLRRRQGSDERLRVREDEQRRRGVRRPRQQLQRHRRRRLQLHDRRRQLRRLQRHLLVPVRDRVVRERRLPAGRVPARLLRPRPERRRLRDRLREDRTAASRSATASTTTATASSTTTRWPARSSARSMGVCAGVQPTCMGQTGWVCKYPATYQDVEDTTKRLRQPRQRLRRPDRRAVPDRQGLHGRLGRLREPERHLGLRQHACRAATAATGSPKTPGVEICNGLDDDCDGKVDELDSASNRTTDDKLIYLVGPERHDVRLRGDPLRRERHQLRLRLDPPALLGPGPLPWSNVTKEEAEAACEKIGSGWRLCTAAEWLDACNGSRQHHLPVRRHLQPRSAATAGTSPRPAGVTTIATGAATTVRLRAVDDDVGRRALRHERQRQGVGADDGRRRPGPFEMRGGAYNTASFTVGTTTTAPGLQCDASIPAPATAVRLPSVGFRCCRTGMLPP